RAVARAPASRTRAGRPAEDGIPPVATGVADGVATVRRDGPRATATAVADQRAAPGPRAGLRSFRAPDARPRGARVRRLGRARRRRPRAGTGGDCGRPLRAFPGARADGDEPGGTRAVVGHGVPRGARDPRGAHRAVSLAGLALAENPRHHNRIVLVAIA